jgi:hypothetical protein
VPILSGVLLKRILAAEHLSDLRMANNSPIIRSNRFSAWDRRCLIDVGRNPFANAGHKDYSRGGIV